MINIKIFIFYIIKIKLTKLIVILKAMEETIDEVIKLIYKFKFK